jgi:hypothetical protein
MIGKLIGAAIGRRVAGRYEGTQGAIVGALVPVVLKRAFGPVGLAVGGAYLAKKLYDSRKRRTRSY